MNIVIKVVNKIKSSALKDRIFRTLCHTNETEFERLLLHTEVRRLSKGKCLSRFYSLFDIIVQFLQEEITAARGEKFWRGHATVINKTEKQVGYFTEWGFAIATNRYETRGEKAY